MNKAHTGWVLLLAYVGFVSLGLPDSVIGVAWPSIRRSFGLPLDALGPYFLVATAGYFLSSFNSGRLVNRWGVGLVLAASSLLTALSLLGYALSPVWLSDKGQYFYSYLSEGKTYKVWAENRDSIKTKLSILDKYRLAGVAGWRKGHETPDIWDTIRTVVRNK